MKEFHTRLQGSRIRICDRKSVVKRFDPFFEVRAILSSGVFKFVEKRFSRTDERASMDYEVESGGVFNLVIQLSMSINDTKRSLRRNNLFVKYGSTEQSFPFRSVM